MTKRRVFHLGLAGGAFALAVCMGALLLWRPGRPDIETREPSLRQPDGGSSDDTDRPVQEEPRISQRPVDFPEGKISTRDVEEMIRVSPLAWRQDVVKVVAKEDVASLIDNLASHSDLHLVDSSLSRPITPKDAEAWPLAVIRLTRVRRLLHLATHNRPEVVAALREAVDSAVAEWPDALKELKEIYTKATADGGTLTTAEPMRWERVQMRCAAGIYLLGVAGDVEDLARISRVHEQTLRMNTAPKQNRVEGMIPPAFTFYAMHRLICTLPLTEFSLDSRPLVEQYRREVSDILPRPRVVTVTGWNANRAEFDPRFMYMDRDRRSLAVEPTIQMPIFEYRFNDGGWFSDLDGHPSQQTEALTAKALEIIARNSDQ